MAGPLTGVKVFDLTRVLAGPTCTQILGDLGADIIKIERPGVGDDTRNFAPPYLQDDTGNETAESAYFAGANRNKRSITLNLADPEGQQIAKKLIADCDILVENFKTGTLHKYGLGYEDLKAEFPHLIYCSITGFGQTGPYAARPGYDALVQAMGGVMSLTGDPEGEPMKVGVSIADIMSGMYATVSILAALRHQMTSGQGQHVDISMLDVHVSWLANQGMSYLATGELPPRLGNNHPSIVPYQVMPSADGFFVLSVGNDPTFVRFLEVAGRTDLLEDPRFATGPERVRHRDVVTQTLNEVTKTKPSSWWLTELEKVKVGCSPINDLHQVFADPQVQHREMVVDMQHPATGERPAKLIASPIKLSETPVSYRHAPPLLGQHTSEYLSEKLGFDEDMIKDLQDRGII